MFTVDQNITDLKVKDRNIFKILYSMNSPQVALPGYAIEEARCYILFFSEGPNLSSFIGLYLPRIDKKVFYSYTSNPFPYEAEKDVEGDAREFAEVMGFLLDEINLSGMAVEDRNTWLEEQIIFGYRSPEGAVAGSDLPQTAPAAVPIEPLAKPAPAAKSVPEPEAKPVPAPAPKSVPEPAVPEVPEQVEVIQETPQRAPAPQPVQAAPLQPAPQMPKQEVPAEARPKPKAKPMPAESRTPPRTKAPSAGRVPVQQQAEEKIEEELPVELEYESPKERPRSLFEDAIREGVVKPPKPKPVKSGPHGPTGVVSRDREALARLLASF